MSVEVVVLLLAAVVAVPLFGRLGLGSVLGYLAAGAVVGPWGLGLIHDVEDILHLSELGVVMLLFIIGLELKPARLWALRRSIFGFGSAQLFGSAVLIGGLAFGLGAALPSAIVIGLVLALSSTAFALQILSERGELTDRHGRQAFATLLFQDLAVVPLLALVPLLAGGAVGEFDPARVGIALGAVVGLVVVGGRVLKALLAVVARTGVREILTATALLTVLGSAFALEQAGLSMALGAFLAGVLLADTEFRHQLEADIEPFKGLLLGLFFLAVGMSMNLGLLAAEPAALLALVAALVGIKFAVLFGLGRATGLDTRASRRLALVLSQSGEFAFIVFGVAVGAGVLSAEAAERWIVVVSISMLSTPLLLFAEDRLAGGAAPDEPYEMPEDDEPRVIIAGFGRFGQMTARVLGALRIPFTALDASMAQVDFVRGYGNEIYYGDASRLDLLEAAGTADATAFVLAIDDVDASVRTAEVVRRHFPHVRVYARARNRQHAYQLMDLGVETIQRETFLSALDLTRDLLVGLGIDTARARHKVELFRQKDLERLDAHRAIQDDEEKVRDLTKAAARELEEMFAADAADRADEEAG